MFAGDQAIERAVIELTTFLPEPLDYGWWAEAFDGGNGWAINGDVDADTQAQDQRDTRALFDLLEQEVVPMFHERDAQGVPPRWVAMMRCSLLTNGRGLSATRMVREYADQVYRRD